MATVDDKKIIFSMVGLNKTIQQNNKQVLKNIYLSFFYGAKIGIIGLNGSGKSTLLKIIAGLDKSYQGEVVFSPGYNNAATQPHLYARTSLHVCPHLYLRYLRIGVHHDGKFVDHHRHHRHRPAGNRQGARI